MDDELSVRLDQQLARTAATGHCHTGDRGDPCHWLYMVIGMATRKVTITLDRVDATSVGRLLAASGTADVVDAHVAICGRRSGQRVVTTDPDDLRRLDPEIQLIEV